MVTRPTSTQDALLNRKVWFVVLVVILAVLREEPNIEVLINDHVAWTI